MRRLDASQRPARSSPAWMSPIAPSNHRVTDAWMSSCAAASCAAVT
jgi:hypothetical protein